MRINKILIIFLVLSFLAGCTNSPQPQITHENTAAATLPTPTAANTPTVQATAAPTLTPSPEENNFNVATHCPIIGYGIPEVQNLPGTLVFGADNKLEFDMVLAPTTGYEAMLTFWKPQNDQSFFYNLSNDDLYYYF